MGEKENLWSLEYMECWLVGLLKLYMKRVELE